MVIYQQIESNKRRTILLLFLFIAFIVLLGWLFGEYTGDRYFGLTIAIIFSLAMALFGYFKGDKLALITAGAKQIKKEDNPYIYRLVENLAITAGLPTPKVYIIQDPAPNAFATGRDPNHASIAVTTGLVEKLENEELEGVLAHELSHIKNYDIRLMMIVIICVGIIALLADWMIRINFYGGRRKESNNNGQAGAIIMVVGIILALLSPLFAKLIQLAISRRREFLADASGVLLTRYPEGLAKALEKINLYKQPLQHANQATAHLYIANPFGGTKKSFAKYFSTHPPIEDRIKALREIA
ncbi:MAG: zinc metalloprotease HtpX [bacterium]